MRPLRLALASIRRAFSEPRLLLWLWLANLLPSLVALAPFVGPARQAFDRSPLGRDSAFLDPEVLRVFLSRLARGASPAPGLLLAAALVALLAPALAGGTLARLSETGRFASGRFLEAAARHYGKNLRLLLWAMLALVPLAAAGGLAARALRRAAERALFQGPLDPWRWALLAAAALAFLAWRAALDVARAWAVSRGERRTRRAAWGAVRLLARRPALLLGYGLVGLAGLAAAWAAALIHAAVPVPGVPGAVAAFAAAQAFVLVRAGFSTAAYAYALGMGGEAAAAPTAASAPASTGAPAPTEAATSAPAVSPGPAGSSPSWEALAVRGGPRRRGAGASRPRRPWTSAAR